MASLESMLRFLMPILRKKAETKRIKKRLSLLTDEVSVELSNREDNSRENNCRKLFISSAPSIRQPSFLHDTVYEKVYDKVQREVSNWKLDSLTSVAAVHESQSPKLVDERDEVFYADLVATRYLIE